MECHLLPAPEVAQALHTTSAGLDAATATRFLAKYGPNQLADTRRKAWWQLLRRQFTDVMILVLLAAASISVLVGLLVGGLTLGTQAWAIRNGDAHWQTMTFTVLCFTQLGSALAIRSSRESLFTLGLFSNKPMLGAVALSVALQLLIIYLPFFNKIFTTNPLSWGELGLAVAISSLVFWAVELQKFLARRCIRLAPLTPEGLM